MSFFKKIVTYLVNYLFPSKCFKCLNYTQEYGLCSMCFNELNFNSKPYCQICGKGFALSIEDNNICGVCITDKPNYDLVRFLLRYDEKSRKIIHAFKYNDRIYLGKFFTKIIFNQYKEMINSADLICPVPMHKLKRIFRLYNQTQYLGKFLSDYSNIKMIPDLIVKKIYTNSQTNLKKSARIKNVKNSFAINDKYNIKNQTILLIDDVVTTGSTISECAKILKKSYAKKVIVIAIAATNLMRD